MTGRTKPDSAAARIIVALDVDGIAALDATVSATRPLIQTYKVGSRLFTAAGPRTIERVHQAGASVFLDLKYHDIPNTVAEAVREAVDLGVRWLTVHAAGGPAMLEAAVAAAGDRVGVLAVTVLTSLDVADLEAVAVSPALEDVVRRRALLARASGCAGLVCSPHEAAMLREAVGPEPLLVTPGIRPSGVARSDQKRAAGPRDAVANGADYLVVGRPITRADDPAVAAQALVEELESVR